MSLACAFGPMAGPQRMVWPEPPEADRFRVGDEWRSPGGLRWRVVRESRDWGGARVAIIKEGDKRAIWRGAYNIGPRGVRGWQRLSWGGRE